MRILEKVLVIAVIYSAFSWFMRFPGGSLVQVIAASALAVLYFLVASKLVYSKGEGPDLPLDPLRILRLGWAVAPIGFLFWFQTWPSSKALLLMSVLAIAAGTAMAAKTHRGLPSWPAIWTRSAAWGALVLLVLALPNYFHISVKYSNQPAYRDAYINFLENREDPEAYDAWQLEYCKIHPLDCNYVE